jgi:hypothetical protein
MLTFQKYYNDVLAGMAESLECSGLTTKFFQENPKVMKLQFRIVEIEGVRELDGIKVYISDKKGRVKVLEYYYHDFREWDDREHSLSWNEDEELNFSIVDKEIFQNFVNLMKRMPLKYIVNRDGTVDHEFQGFPVMISTELFKSNS